MTPEELKKLQDELQSTIHDLRQYGERAEAEAKRFGAATAETKATIDKINQRIDQLEVQLKRPAQAGSVAPGSSDEPKAKAFMKFLREGKAALTPDEHKALIEDATGEILVPEQIEAEIMRTLPKLTIIRSLATVRTITKGNRIRLRSMSEVAGGWGKVEVGAALNESNLVPAEAGYQYSEDWYGLTRIGEDELDDADQNLEALVSDSFARAFAEAEDTAFVNGTGHANQQPTGILNGAVVTRVNAGQAAAITADDFIGLAYEVPAQYRRNGVYVVRSSTERAMRLLKDNNGQYLWQPSLQAGSPANFNGYPIHNQDDIPAIPAAGVVADVGIFGDIRAGYRILDRLGLSIKRLAELYAAQGMIGFLAHRRVGGAVVRAEAMRVLRVPAA